MSCAIVVVDSAAAAAGGSEAAAAGIGHAFASVDALAVVWERHWRKLCVFGSGCTFVTGQRDAAAPTFELRTWRIVGERGGEKGEIENRAKRRR